jgi:uncharacterized CHY-type Zn-finger protein
MASNSASSPRPIYHDPGSDGHSRPSRSPSRKGRASSLAIPHSPRRNSHSHSHSPRTSCPQDDDAFSYNPTHLSEWYIPQDTWNRLTPQLQATLAGMQHSGAAVLTGKCKCLTWSLPPYRLASSVSHLPIRYTCLKRDFNQMLTCFSLQATSDSRSTPRVLITGIRRTMRTKTNISYNSTTACPACRSKYEPVAMLAAIYQSYHPFSVRRQPLRLELPHRRSRAPIPYLPSHQSA